jgi:hypothetical protein
MAQIGTETTRFNSKKVCVLGWREIYRIFVGEFRDWIRTDEGKIFLDIDYSQSDDVFMAYESQDPDKMAVVESGADAHAVNGELFFGTPYDRYYCREKAGDPRIVHPIYGIRQLSKRIVHGTNFQMAAMTLYVTMGAKLWLRRRVCLGILTPDR